MPPSAGGPKPRDLLGHVSREIRDKLETYADELRRWQRVKNLVGPSTLDEIWTRHFLDSLQLADLAEGRVWADIGAGAGFPGLVLAIARPNTFVHLIESDGRKCAFLRHVARRLSAPVRIWNSRAEETVATLDPKPEIVTARALAPLENLLELSERLLMAGATALFPKGRDYAAELTKAAESWRFDAEAIPSCVDPEGRILRIRHFGGRK